MSIEKHPNIHESITKGLKIIFSDTRFLFFGSIVALPEILVQFIFNTVINTSEKELLASPEMTIVGIVCITIFLAIEALGITAIILLTNESEHHRKIQLPKRAIFLVRCRALFRLNALILVLILATISFLMIPSNIAVTKSLESLAQLLFFSALGLTLSISVLLFFLRQFAAMYLSLSNISQRSALENSYILFRRHLRETIWLALFFFITKIFLILVFSITHYFFTQWIPTNEIFPIFILVLTFIFLAILKTWNWATWTIFFRSIALPKKPETTLQEEKNMVQQSSTINLDKI